MSDIHQQTITLDSKSLQGAIDMLSGAAATLALTPRQRVVYRMLMISVDGAILSLALCLVVVGFTIDTALGWDEVLLGLAAFAFVICSVLGTIAFVLNVPLLRRMSRERARLKRLGLTALSRSLWKASRRTDWVSRLRSVLLLAFGVLTAVTATVYLANATDLRVTAALALGCFFAAVAAMMFGARHLRNQREQMALAADAQALKKALESLRDEASATHDVEVPTELVSQVARIESAQIARRREQAILASVASQGTGYAVTLQGHALTQRGALDLEARLECEDLVAGLSSGTRPAAGGKAHSAHVELSYEIDDAARLIRVTDVRRIAAGAPETAAGAHHA